jgi:Cys-tRNA(Pro)/Cys-tRNA(Cys) deacylase
VAATPAIQAAEAAGIAFSLHEYEHDPRAPSYGDEAAEKLGVDARRLFKTLVVSVDGALAVACVPVSAQLDLKRLGKRARMADKAQAQSATATSAAARARSGSASGCRRTSTRRRSSTRRSS